MKGKHDEGSFWISYSDLATGLMMVFLLLMVVMMFAQIQQNEIQQAEEAERQEKRKERDEEIRTVVERLVVMLGQKPGLARELKKALGSERVDPVNARFKLDEDVARFERAKSEWSTPEEGEKAVSEGLKYLCALWKWERAQSNARADARLDPDGEKSVQHIYVVGHADLDSSDGETNWGLTLARAELAKRALMDRLSQCASGDVSSCVEVEVNQKQQVDQDAQTCDWSSIWRYAQERVVVAGAAHVEHCKAESARLKGECTKGDSLNLEDASKKAFRRVDFQAELTNSDVTGLVVELYRLKSSSVVDEAESSVAQQDQRLGDLLEALAKGCWGSGASPSQDRYQGCSRLASECQVLAGHGRRNTKEWDDLRCGAWADARRPAP